MKHKIPTSEMRNLHKERDADKEMMMRGGGVLFSRCCRRGWCVLRPLNGVCSSSLSSSSRKKVSSSIQNRDDDSDERSDFGIDDAMLFVLFVVFKLEGEE